MASTCFTVTVRATSIMISNGEEAMYLLSTLIDNLTYEDEFAEDTKTLGFIYDKDTDTLFLHKGVDIEYLQRCLGNVKIEYDLYHPYKPMKFEYEEIIAPRNDEQVDVIDFITGQGYHDNINASQIFLVKLPGFGKAEPYSRKIPTPTEKGYTLMGDLKVGDYVFDRQGNPTKITAIFEQGCQDVYRVTFNDGRYARCLKDHLWAVKTKQGEAFKVCKTEELMNDCCTYIVPKNGKPHTKHKYRIPVCDPVNYPTREVPIDPWVLGCFIGNGCCRERVLTISSGNHEIPERIGLMCGFNVKKNSDHNYSYTFYKDGHPVLTKDFFRDVPELIGLYSSEKHIPDVYMINDITTRLRLLQGLMDTDGTININQGRYTVSYTSTSLKLLNNIKWILYSFGMSGNICIDKRPDKYRDGYCGILVFRVPNVFKQYLFTLSYKYNRAYEAKSIQQSREYGLLIISDIIPDGKEQCRCIMVDNPEHLYLTENFIVTHNTFCAGVGLCKLKMKTLIIMHRDNLRRQWMNSLFNMNGLTSKEVHEIDSSEELYNIALGKLHLDYDVYLMTHATFRAGINRIQKMKDVMNITKNLGIGLKIIDEAHLEFRDTLIMDSCFNVKRNLYLTATAGRSAKDENSIFRHVFSSAIFYKPSLMLTSNMPKKWVNYTTVEIDTHCKPNIYKYRVAGGKGMNGPSYGKWVIQYDKNNTHFKCIVDLLKLAFEKDQYSKVLVFLPLIDLCEECAYFLKRKLDNDKDFTYDLDIRTICSKNSKKDNEYAKKSDVIITTIQSCGTGTDIKGITTIISCSPYVSRITCQQVFGRIRYNGKIGDYYDIYDASVPMDRFWLKSRNKTFKQLALNVKHITWCEDEE